MMNEEQIQRRQRRNWINEGEHDYLYERWQAGERDAVMARLNAMTPLAATLIVLGMYERSTHELTASQFGADLREWVGYRVVTKMKTGEYL